MKNFLKDLPPLIRGIIILVILAVIIFVLWKIYQYFKKKAENKPNAEVVSDAQKEINRLGPASFSDTTYQGTANAIASLLGGCETGGSEEDVIREVIKVVKIPVDWYKLIVAFGTRDIADCGSFGFSSTNYDLVSLLKDQLDTSLTGGFTEGTFTYTGIFTNSKDILTKYLQTIGINF